MEIETWSTSNLRFVILDFFDFFYFLFFSFFFWVRKREWISCAGEREKEEDDDDYGHVNEELVGLK